MRYMRFLWQIGSQQAASHSPNGPNWASFRSRRVISPVFNIVLDVHATLRGPWGLFIYCQDLKAGLVHLAAP